MSLHKARIREFEQVLESDDIDLDKLRKLSFSGIPDIKGLRSFVWKVLLHYIPKENSLRKSTLSTKRKLYEQFIEEIIVSPGDANDHPLNISPDSCWFAYFKDNEVLLQIDKDVRRLCPDMSFFQSATQFPCNQVVNSDGAKRLHQRVEQSVLEYRTLEHQGLGLARLRSDVRRSESQQGDYTPLPEGCEAHWEVVERILFIYAKLNPGQGYVQGMNEIIGPIYHSFAVDPDENSRNVGNISEESMEWLCERAPKNNKAASINDTLFTSFEEYAEADCFFCFTNLMSEIRDFFLRTMDEAEGGINFMMEKLSNCLKKNDVEIWQHLEVQELRPQYYSFRWLTLLLSQEFSLPDVERMWDSLFADQYRFEFLIEICCAMILLVKDELMRGDFATNVKLLQNYPPMDVSIIISKAAEISNR